MAYIAFSYKKGNSLIHKIPAWLKILIIPVLSILFFKLPVYCSVALVIAQFILSCCLKFTLREQYADLKPVIYYAFLLYFINYFSNLYSLCLQTLPESENLWNSVAANVVEGAKSTFSNKETFFMLIKLFCAIQLASIIFKTTSSLQLREGIGLIEASIRKVLPVSKKNKFTNALALFMCFLPTVYKNWEQCKRAWFARGGKKSIKMYISIFPVFFSVGIKQAYNTSRAMIIREA